MKKLSDKEVIEKMNYQIIYADPPWKYQDKGCNGNCEAHYKTMSIQDLEFMGDFVKDLSNENCVLFLWTTYPMLKEALRVIEAWGFKYKSIAFQWIKLNKKNGKPFYGLGRWTRGNTEPCLLATKGKPQRISKSVFQLIQEPIAEHSKKPNIVRDKIVELMGNLPRIELFARERERGWDAWGDEV
jgi:N6-adenosine-specific RNA methylase IME4